MGCLIHGMGVVYCLVSITQERGKKEKEERETKRIRGEQTKK